MNFKILIIVAVSAIIAAYVMGYSNARTKGRLEIERIKTDQAAAVAAAQEEVKKDYEQRMQSLSADLERVRNDNSERVRQLAKFRAADRDLAACRRDRDRLATVAVGLEDVASRAVSYLGAVTQ